MAGFVLVLLFKSCFLDIVLVGFEEGLFIELGIIITLPLETKRIIYFVLNEKCA